MRNKRKSGVRAIAAALMGIGVYMDGQTVGRLVSRVQMNTARAYG